MVLVTSNIIELQVTAYYQHQTAVLAGQTGFLIPLTFYESRHSLHLECLGLIGSNSCKAPSIF